MVWRKATTMQDRILACLPYLVPILEVLTFGTFLFAFIPPLGLLFLPLAPLTAIYFYSIGGIAVVPLIVFFGLYLGVVRNETLSHFLRFNTIQALLLAIFTFLCKALLDLLHISQSVVSGGFGSATSLPIDLIFWGIVSSAIFIAVVGASIYAIVQSLRGQYAEMPLISEAAHSQVRY